MKERLLVSVKIKINITILVISLVLFGLLFIGITGFRILSGLRAYVGGEGLWAKGQREASYQLTQYILTGEKIRYQSFLDRLKVPLGDKVARLELEKKTPVYEIIFQGFVDGGNHPEDIPAMISLYKKYKNINYINDAVEQWEIGDGLIKELLKIGEEIHHHITNNNMSKEQLTRYLITIDILQKRLNEAENQFSYFMSVAARWATELFIIIMLIFFVAGSIVCFIILRLISGIIYELNDKNLKLKTQAKKERTITKELKESEEKYRFITENATDIIWTSDLEGNIAFVTPSHENLTGYTVEETIGMNIAKFTTQKSMETIAGMIMDRLATDIERKNDQYKPLTVEMESKHKNGTIRQCEVNAKFIRDNNGKPIGIIGILRDATQRKELETQLQQAVKMEAIGTLAGGIAHDFNNLLTGILGNTSLMRDDISPSHPNYGNLTETENYVKSAVSLTKQLLGFARGGKYEVEPTNLNELIKSHNRMFGRTKKEIAIKGKYENKLWISEVDKGQIEQVLMNIYVNAWQAMPDGGELYIQTENVTLSNEYKQPFHVTPGKYVKISVTDTGIGMDEQ
ncbi:MAG: PAS domain S-box protein, partial [Desulfobacterales bacterium]|nr:PAS domain S-box protein [Desulfobacterales bacterium]